MSEQASRGLGRKDTGRILRHGKGTQGRIRFCPNPEAVVVMLPPPPLQYVHSGDSVFDTADTTACLNNSSTQSVIFSFDCFLTSRTLFRAICNSIFSSIIDQAPFAIEELMQEVNAAEDSDSGQASEGDDKDQIKGKMSKPLCKKWTRMKINGTYNLFFFTKL